MMEQPRLQAAPLQNCTEIKQLLDGGAMSDAEKLMLAMHIASDCKHDADCPAQDSCCLEELKSELGLDKLPDE